MLDLELKGPSPVNSNIIGAAIFSKDEQYRYILSRDWSDDKIIVWVMLNPSSGNDKILEHTTTGCMKRALNWGCGGMIVLNLFAYISSNPNDLKNVQDPVGKWNDIAISNINQVVPPETIFIAGWGTNGTLYNRDKEVVKLLQDRDLYCLGINKDGSPKHPLHISHSIRPELWCGAGDHLLWS